MKSEFTDINAIDVDGTTCRFNNTEQRKSERWFTSTCSAHYTNLSERKQENIITKSYHMPLVVLQFSNKVLIQSSRLPDGSCL